MRNKLIGLVVIFIALISFKTINASVSFKVGDYINMTPSNTNYTISKDKTGTNSDQIINPSELNIWRVIKVNSDGTIVIVSENVSNTVSFSGEKGYLNFIGVLNEIARQYETKFTIDSHHIGFNNQKEYLDDKDKGDNLYENDLNLLQMSLGTAKADNSYWLASRYYYYDPNDLHDYYYGRVIEKDGKISAIPIYGVYTRFGGVFDYLGTSSIRPVLTLKSGLSAEGNGAENNPYVLIDNEIIQNGDEENNNQNNNSDQNNNLNKIEKDNLPENPSTGKFISFVIIGIGIILAIVIYIVSKKKNKIYKI